MRGREGLWRERERERDGEEGGDRERWFCREGRGEKRGKGIQELKSRVYR